MKRNYKILIVFMILAGLMFVSAAWAANPASPSTNSVSGLLKDAAGSAKYDTTPEKSDLVILVGNVIQVFLSILGIIFMGLALYGGYLWMNARGNEEQVTKSKNLLRDAVIGLVIIVGAYAITYFVMATIAKNYITNPGF
ncbi:hypothetical protein COV49_04150 [Candidatus Falkowbacteria bacterium CG11_big_fil_rev_8_21_14_0_20_39_10]|uniref:DUF4190 domain-containing protein n=1 Tax=Candidatus Falkowbacteria bacterium CG11_big_fil_rev_8_21_14_0_20_39_10 TaxID=1974570 RepID=A0A2M6K844_9BACT|nr:MAG: hypothetical protein COV49_04150 [Candidatus Falkowbacteria bacterium CG11_big_fil_rev_8_21_14_0_20_39_10]